MLIKIPVRMHLLKYLKSKVGSERIEIKHYCQAELFQDQSEIIFIQRELSKALYPFISTTYQWKLEQLGKQFKYGMIALTLKEYMATNKRLFISNTGVLKFNEKIDQLMVSDLLQKIDKAISEKRRHDECIFEFMNNHSIDEDDIRFDSLKKRCYRERLKTKEKIFLDNTLKRTSGVLDLSFSEKLIQS